MTEDEMRKFLDSNADAIKAQVKTTMIKKFIEDNRWAVTEGVSKAVNDFVAAEIVPAVSAHLVSQKSIILDGIISSLSAVADDLAKSLAKDASKNAESDYRRAAIVKAIFGIH